jgi:putative hydrolase of the HAD superfamily
MMDGFFTKQEQDEFFDVAILSGNTGYAKPGPEIYQLICGKLGVRPAESVMVDDVEDNCKGAIAVGMQAIQYQSFEQIKRELERLLG